MLNKKLLPAALATSLFAGAVASAQAAPEISGNVALTSDYKFRGISQTDESPAIQGGFDIAWDNGIYLGTWGSSVNFDNNFDFDGSLELDYYGGWAGQITDNVGVDVGYIYYDYPGDDGLEGDYQEVYLSVGLWDGALGVHYSDDYFGETGNFMYLYGDYSFGIGENFSVDLHVGYNDFDDDFGFLSSDKGSYVDYSVGVTASWLAVDWTLAYVGTDLDEEDVYDYTWGDGEVIFTISKSM